MLFLEEIGTTNARRSAWWWKWLITHLKFALTLRFKLEIWVETCWLECVGWKWVGWLVLPPQYLKACVLNDNNFQSTTFGSTMVNRTDIGDCSASCKGTNNLKGNYSKVISAILMKVLATLEKYKQAISILKSYKGFLKEVTLFWIWN